MSNLALSFGIGIVLGIILFFILERVGVLHKLVGLK
jgi:capsular polysaccharide biosynthesis protein